MISFKLNLWFHLACLVAAVTVPVDTQSVSCQYHGNTYRMGDAWVDVTGCHPCECNEYGVQCWDQDSACQINSSTAQPGDHVCLYVQHTYLVGEVFKAVDECNTCLCTERGMQCTARACNNTGFAQPSTEPLYGECNYGNGWYRYHSQWQAGDGCNTCYCYTIGNYRGMHVCTRSTCQCQQNNPIVTG